MNKNAKNLEDEHVLELLKKILKGEYDDDE